MDASPADETAQEPVSSPENPQTIAPKPAATPRYRSRPYHVHAAFLPLVFLLGLGAGYLLWDRSAKTPPPAQAAAATQKAPKRYNIPLENNPSLGPQDAPVTLVMYSDYQCPFCRQWYTDVFKTLVTDYKNQIRFVYKDFPLYGLHENAEAAAEAARCAGDQGKYWEYQEMLFTGDNGLGAGALDQYAQGLGLDPESFRTCVSTHKYQDQVKGDYQFATNLGIQSTPTFFINGLAVIGAQPLEVFKQVIDQELALVGK